MPRGKVLGGSSAINGQTFIRGAPEDYDTWASWGNEGWSYLDCLPYFRKLENDADFHGSDGPVPVRHHQRETWPVTQEAFFQAATAAGYPLPSRREPPRVHRHQPSAPRTTSTAYA